MIENGKLIVGGNTIKFWFGKQIEKFGIFINSWGKEITVKNKTRIVTNPMAKFCNPFTIIINFTVDNSDKYQIVLQGDYKEKYKDSVKDNNGDSIIDMKDDELLMTIYQQKNEWFKKD